MRSNFGKDKPIPMKYAVLMIALIFAGCGGGEYETFTIDGKAMQVATEDLENMNWADAKMACNSLGNGWRLPSIEEHKAIYEQLKKQGKGNFKMNDFYWSSSEYDAERAWYFNYDYGKAYYIYSEKRLHVHVRAVRDKPRPFSHLTISISR